ncbi:MAG TPA: DUF2935 domain-containing protein [Pyrinomonadaceae bacterium]|nr:DUF2935 domain-containing protein [Pyrinomonadaceae bacterium]
MSGVSGNSELSDRGRGHGRALRPTRRQVLLGGGAALVGLTLSGDALAAILKLGQATGLPGVATIAGAKKPVFVAAAGSTDPVAHSLADSLFWLEQEFEHAKFFLMHMPSPDLDTERAQVLRFQNDFAARLAQVRAGGADRSGLAGFNRPTIELVRRFLDVKRRMEKAQESGQLKSLAWPTFFEHVALEGERFANRLEKFSEGKVELERDEVVDFWSRIMADHADFVAHLLDPEERALIEKSRGAADAWRAVKSGGPKGKVEGSLAELLAFKQTAQKGVEAGQIKSIIHPLLADHVVREALKFSDELKRAA